MPSSSSGVFLLQMVLQSDRASGNGAGGMSGQRLHSYSES